MSRQPYYILVCGGRHFHDYDFLKETLHDCLLSVRDHYPDRRMVIVHGDALGADKLAGNWANTFNVPCFKIPAEWDLWGTSAAGPIRNAQMLDWVPVDRVIAFTGGSGTASMAALAKARGIPVTHAVQDF